eukprot:SAG22_NODE_17833_length_297_cov_4.833333_1_plen_64_part_01
MRCPMDETRDHFLRQGTVGMNFVAVRTSIGILVAALNNKQRLASVFRLVLDAELLEHGKIVVGF